MESLKHLSPTEYASLESKLVVAFIVANFLAFFVILVCLRKFPIRGPLVLRFLMGAIMIHYGWLKFTKGQGFSLPISGEINSLSGASLFWYFFGYSYFYLVYIGILECVAGLLLFFHRTWRLGALLSLTLLGNIAVMDYVYNVGHVKYLVTNFTAILILLIYLDREPFLRAFRALIS